MVANDNKDIIDAQSSTFRQTEGINSCTDHLTFYKRAKKGVAGSLSAAEVQHYQELAEDTTRFLKAPPTPAMVFEYVQPISLFTSNSQNRCSQQPAMIPSISSAIQERVGWKAGQFGDVICFVAVAYRTRDHTINTQL
jgi:hypothetical protein